MMRTTTEIALPLTGGCLCGACRYELRAAPFMLYVCHCTDCQRQSGSAFGMSMPSPRDAFHVIQGEPARFERTMPSGRRAVTRFCSQCASRVFSEPADPAIVVLRPGTLDDTRWLQPCAQLWTGSALPWACVDADLKYSGNPDDYAAMRERWRGLGIRFG